MSAYDGVTYADPRSLANSTLIDLLKTTLNNHPWDGKFEMLQKYIDYPVCNAMMALGRVEFQGGNKIIKNISYKESDHASFVRPWQSTEVSNTDVQARLGVDWINAQTYWSVERDEMLQQRGKAKLINLVDVKRGDAMMALANLMEERAWQLPATSDNIYPNGIPYWVTPIVSGDSNGFNDTYPTGFTDIGGLSTTTYSRWRNYSARWTAAGSFAGVITADDVTVLTTMLRKIRFHSPNMVSQAHDAAFNMLRLYTGNEVYEGLEERARAQNDQLGNDVGRYAGDVLIARLPVTWVEYLDYASSNDTTYPLYAINHNYLHACVRTGNWLKEDEPIRSREQHLVFTTFVDTEFNFICANRRGCGMVSAVAA